jgi:phosphopantetheinyl transferase
MPVMTLDPAKAREIGGQLRAVIAPPAPPQQAPPPHPPEPAAAPLSTAAPTPPADPRLGVLQAHFGLMNEFLASQTRAMERLAGALGSAPQADAAAPSTGSLLGEIVERGARRLVARRRFNPSRDRFLCDHTFGSAPSESDPGLLGLPVVPFTISMELIAEAAQALDGGRRRAVGLRRLRGHRWLALDTGELDLTIEAELSPDAGEATVRVLAGGSELAFEGIVEVADAYPAAPAASAFDIGREQAPRYTPDMLYGETRAGDVHRAALFHGPAFQAVTGIRRVGTQGIEAAMRVLQIAAFGDSAPLQTDPAVLDAAGQLVGYWVAERFGVDLSFFPFACREYRQFAAWPAAGTPLLCQARIRLADPAGGEAAFDFLDAGERPLLRIAPDSVTADQPPGYEKCRLAPAAAWIEADFRFLGPDGRLLAVLDGWSDRYFSISHRFYRTRLWPRREFFSERLADGRLQPFVRRIDRKREAYLERGWGIWKRVLAHLTLSRRERAAWHALPAQGERRTEWLLGRIAAKDAVRQWARERHALDIAPADIEVLPDAQGRPVVDCPALRSRGLQPIVSISHDGAAALGVAVDPGVAVGIDHASVSEPHAYADLEIGFTPAELALLRAAPPADREALMLRFWCAKEAAAKAEGRGLDGDPRRWPVAACDIASGGLTIVHEGRAYAVETSRVGDEIVALCRIAGMARAVGNAA